MLEPGHGLGNALIEPGSNVRTASRKITRRRRLGGLLDCHERSGVIVD